MIILSWATYRLNAISIKLTIKIFIELEKKFTIFMEPQTSKNALVIENTLFQQHKRRLYTWTSPDGQSEIRLIIFFAAKDGKPLYSQQK